jgi:hypothetical protein
MAAGRTSSGREPMRIRDFPRSPAEASRRGTRSGVTVRYLPAVRRPWPALVLFSGGALLLVSLYLPWQRVSVDVSEYGDLQGSVDSLLQLFRGLGPLDGWDSGVAPAAALAALLLVALSAVAFRSARALDSTATRQSRVGHRVFRYRSRRRFAFSWEVLGRCGRIRRGRRVRLRRLYRTWSGGGRAVRGLGASTG